MAGSTRPPQTPASLKRDLEAVGIGAGMTLVVHASLSAIGWVVGGAPTVVAALIEILGDSGTLAMPAATPLCADPADWSSPRVAEQWLETVRASLPIFDPRTTPSTMGAIAEAFRGWPGTRRSHHPLESVCARGPLAEELTRDHPLAFPEGPGSPFGKMHDAGGWVLLLGVGFNRCTALHYAESVSSARRTTTCRFPVMRPSGREWIEVPNVADDNDTLFPRIGEGYVSSSPEVCAGKVGEASAVVFPMRSLVAYAKAYFEDHLEAGTAEG